MDQHIMATHAVHQKSNSKE